MLTLCYLQLVDIPSWRYAGEQWEVYGNEHLL